MENIIAFLSFGSNMGDRYATWEKTLTLLALVPETRVLQAAQPIETDPVGPIPDQPRYLNSVIAIETRLAPLALLDQLLHIEQQLGRVRKERWGPRTVDLDILLYGDETIDSPRLRIPHPELKNRPFLTALMKEAGCSDVIASEAKQSDTQRSDASSVASLIAAHARQIASSQGSSQ